MGNAFFNRKSLAIGGVLLLALGLRLWGANFGLPYLDHPDEGYLTMPALNILKTGDFRPYRLEYGSAYIYSLALLYIPLFVFDVARGTYHSVSDLPVIPDFHIVGAYPSPEVFLLARIFTAILGTVTVYLIYYLGKRIVGWRAGLLGAAFLAIAPLHVANSHFATTDVPMTFLATLAMIPVLNVFERGDRQDYFWAGICVGLTASTKYSGGIIIVAFMVAHLMRAKDWGDIFNVRLVIGLIATVMGFLIGTPYAVDLPYFLNWVAFQVSVYRNLATQGEYLAGPVPLSLSRDLFLGPMGIIACLGVVGLAWLIRRYGRLGIVTSMFFVLLIGLAFSQTVRLNRWLVPAISSLTLGAGIGFDALIVWMKARLPQVRYQQLVTLTIFCFVAMMPAIATVQSDILLASPSIRAESGDWIRNNISADAKIIADPMGPAIGGWARNLSLTWNFVSHDPSWYSEQKFDYLIISDVFVNPDLTVESVNAYHQLMSRFSLVKTFQGTILGVGDFYIWIYQINP